MHKMPPLFTTILALFLALCTPAWALRKEGNYTTTTKNGPDALTEGWFINLGITGARGKLTPEAPKVMEVAYIFDKTPAAGVLQVGDRIVGANGKPFRTEPQVRLRNG